MQIPDAVRALERDLLGIFDQRLQSLVLLGGASPSSGTPTLAVVDVLGVDDLAACAARVAGWRDAGLSTPIIMPAGEFSRSLDAFPLEFGNMLATYVVVSGANVFEGLRVDPADLRRTCERQARSHLLHLREGYLETRGRGDALADLIRRSAAPLSALVRNVARLHGSSDDHVGAAAAFVESAGGFPAGSLGHIVSLVDGGPLSSADARRIFPQYLDAMDRMTNGIDRWSTT